MSSGRNDISFDRLITLAVAIALVFILATNLDVSGTPNFWRFSYLKWAFLAVLASSIMYLLLSLRLERLRRLNVFLLYGVIANAILVEIVLHLFPALVPQNLIPILPTDARNSLAAMRNLVTVDQFQGEGLLYRYRAGERPFRDYPWVTVDADGFRNPSVPAGPVDVVYFGDSVAFARHARKDLGDLLRERGISAYSLAMGGNAALQYLEAYRKFVIERHVPHRSIVVLIESQTDFYESLKATRVRLAGGDYRDYLGVADAIGPEWPNRQPLWIVAIAVRLPAFFRINLSDVAGSMSAWAGEWSEAVLPYGKYKVTPEIFDYPALDENSEAWLAFAKPLDDMMALASQARARIFLAVMPTPGLLYRDYIANLDSYKEALEERHRKVMSLLRRRYEPVAAKILDFTDPLAVSVGSREIAAGPLDYHFNQEGWAVIADELAKHLTF